MMHLPAGCCAYLNQSRNSEQVVTKEPRGEGNLVTVL